MLTANSYPGNEKVGKKNKKLVGELLLSYSMYSTGGEVCIGEEGPWAFHEDTCLEITFNGLYENLLDKKYKHFGDYHEIVYTAGFIPKKDNEVFLVCVKYTDGCTFGRTTGHIYVEGVYKTDKEAEEVLKSIHDDTYRGYKAWDCWFGGLETAYIEGMIVE